MATLLLICRETSKLGTGFDGAILGHKAFNGLSLKKPIQRFLDASKSWGWVVLGVRKNDGQDQKQQLYNNSNIMQHLGVFAVWSSSCGGGSISKNPSETDWIKPETCQVPAAWAAPGHQKASHHATSGLTQAWDMSAVPRMISPWKLVGGFIHSCKDWSIGILYVLGPWGGCRIKHAWDHQSNNVKRVVGPSPYEANSRLLPHLPRCRGKILHEGSARSLGLSGA